MLQSLLSLLNFFLGCCHIGLGFGDFLVTLSLEERILRLLLLLGLLDGLFLETMLLLSVRSRLCLQRRISSSQLSLCASLLLLGQRLRLLCSFLLALALSKGSSRQSLPLLLLSGAHLLLGLYFGQESISLQVERLRDGLLHDGLHVFGLLDLLLRACHLDGCLRSLACYILRCSRLEVGGLLSRLKRSLSLLTSNLLGSESSLQLSHLFFVECGLFSQCSGNFLFDCISPGDFSTLQLLRHVCAVACRSPDFFFLLLCFRLESLGGLLLLLSGLFFGLSLFDGRLGCSVHCVELASCRAIRLRQLSGSGLLHE